MEDKDLLNKAIGRFWDIRGSQRSQNVTEDDNRGAVLGGKQLDGFAEMMRQTAVKAGVPKECIYTKGCAVPGYFRASKNWDFMIVTPNNKLVALIEFKSQIGSYGNNFNNRSEEAIGSSEDFWTAFRENQFPGQQAPWLGYMMVVGKDELSQRLVSNGKMQFNVLPEFEKATYIDRYRILCSKLIRERKYTSVALLWTDVNRQYGDVCQDLAMDKFICSFVGHIKGWENEFK